ncbi:glycosyltransferase [Tenacibaculum sp. IB213877]|uniref:glycosyltransferase n=1 Tax=Tenacibaculum sp. IB213877 TaxID=3097351 RepID=UPI002A59858F|nr:glycosyltransferase [Tenacibaculum sp. IB213877]MDY0781369.1 glycosyltransferase [Tenacibaculum sp. IB213877]
MGAEKIIFFVTGLDSGGIENYLLRFLQYKATAFSEVVVYCKGGKGGQLEKEYLKIPNVKIVKNEIGFFNPLHYIKLTVYFKKEQFEIVCDFTGNFAGLILLSAKQAGIQKRVVFYRGATNHFKESKLRLLYDSFVKSVTYKYATNILSNSQAAFDFFYDENKQDNRFQVIYNGLNASKFNVGNKDLRQELNIPNDAFVIGHTGRFNSAKNHSVIVEVAEKLVRKHSNIYFILCGNEVKDALKDQVRILGIEKNVRLFNNRNDIPVLLNTMNAYFFPSITEGQPNALIEAMVMGLPFVASDIEPIKETVGSYEYLFNPTDIENFYTTLEKLYKSNEPKKMELREKTMKQFNYKERFEEFYNKLV